MNSDSPKILNGVGLAHLAFEVDDVPATLQKVIDEGGKQLGEMVTAQYPDNVTAVFVYARDIEGNIIELQSWKKQVKNWNDNLYKEEERDQLNSSSPSFTFAYTHI